MKLYDLARVCRSKNAGPFLITIDLMFDNAADYAKVLATPTFTPEQIAERYQVPAAEVRIKPFERILTVKVVLPRRCSSGSPGDCDVYGCQQHFPLGNWEIGAPQIPGRR